MATKKDMWGLSRRQFLHTVAAGAAVAGGATFRELAWAQDSGELVVSNWGGDWSNNVIKALEGPALEQKGVNIRRDLAAAPVRKAKLLAERNLPRGTIDVAHFTDADAYELQIQGALEPIDYSRVPNAAHLLPGMRSPYFVPWMYSGVELIYNPDKIKTPPTSFKDLMNPAYAGKVGLIDQIYFNYLYAYALVGGGSMQNVTPGLAKLLELKRAVQPRIYPSHEQIAAAMSSGEVWISANYKARAAQWTAANLPIRGAYPSEGGIAIQFGVVIPKHARNKELAYRYINEMLAPVAARQISTLTYYAPSTDHAGLPPDLLREIDFTEAQRKQLHYVDYAYAAKNQPQWLEWWNKEIKV
ncbi:ABC transporter substrate-binding protein [Pandoraea terrigena]|uniref:ABC transporter substrate-binding protein n=1 Tax=Pandoraea terrigena TaxID=2508292 RepID=A0A5E4WUN3_9BURK|nr:extracellular solute-binding protein [Pandoraea terrigena]VVE27993.1 ABC transporter substrate-binding protein [Pandoraea terrigena]